jgi:hypothetical protein
LVGWGPGVAWLVGLGSRNAQGAFASWNSKQVKCNPVERRDPNYLIHFSPACLPRDLLFC